MDALIIHTIDTWNYNKMCLSNVPTRSHAFYEAINLTKSIRVMLRLNGNLTKRYVCNWRLRHNIISFWLERLYFRPSPNKRYTIFNIVSADVIVTLEIVHILQKVFFIYWRIIFLQYSKHEYSKYSYDTWIYKKVIA